MPQTTPTLGMKTYDLVNDGGVNFSTWRIDLAGYTNSALTKIDAFATQTLADINLLKSNPPIVRIPAIKTDDFSYAVTGITEITEYRNGMYINLSLNSTNLGTISLNINNLGSKGVYKIGTDGLVANMSAGDLKLNKMYLFRYNGTAWVWVNAVTSDQINVVGTAGNLTKISTNNTLEDAGVTFSNTTTNNALAQRTASGQIKGVVPVDNDDLVNKTYADTKAPINSPTLTGTPLAPTATTGTNTTQIATTAFVNSEIDNDRPYGTVTSTLTNGGTGVVGTSTKVAREDHTHTMPTSVLQSQVINDLTTGGETNVLSAQQGAELNSAIGQISNPALNINPDFQINQRGKNLYTCATGFTATYTWDRWQIIDTGQVESTPDGIKLTMTNVFFQFRQLVDINANILHGKKVTLSCKVGENIYKGTGLLDKSLNNTPIDVDMGNDIFLQLRHNPELSTPIVIRIMNKVAGKTLTGLKWVKLELGEIATPLSPRNYGEELALCQRYYEAFFYTENQRGILKDNYYNPRFVQKRVLPTLNVVNPNISGTASSVTIMEVGYVSVVLKNNTLVGASPENDYIFRCQLTIDAEIY